MLNIIHWEHKITLDSLRPTDMCAYNFNTTIIYINLFFSCVQNSANGMQCNTFVWISIIPSIISSGIIINIQFQRTFL